MRREVLYSEERMCIVSITSGIKKGGDKEKTGSINRKPL